MIKRLWAAVAAGILTTGVLGGGAPPEEKYEATGTSAAKAGRVYYLNFKPEQAEQWKALAAKYTEETGVPVTVETAASDNYATQLRSEMAKKDAPTLFQVNGPVGLSQWKDYCYDPVSYTHLPDAMSYQLGAMIEPFVVGLQAMRNSGIGFSDNAVVVGCGAIGMMTIQALRSIGAGQIIAIDLEPFKLDMAKKMGADVVINPKECEDVAQAVRDLTDGYGAQYGFECVGNDRTFWDINTYVRDGGTVTYLGLLINDGTSMPMSSAVMRGLTYPTLIRYTNLFDRAMSMLELGRSDILPVMTHEYDFDHAVEAYEKALTDKRTSIKVMINF